ncbi:MAG: PP0621 family protein [Limnohabitans sp.]
MKIFLFLLTLLFAVWLWRRNRLNKRKDQPSTPPQSQAPSPTALTPSPMQSCQHCGVHMPQADMVQGQQGHYCSLAHRQAASDKPH